MNIEAIYTILNKIIYDSAEELINMYHNPTKSQYSLIFPKDGNGVIRLSEQELRFVIASNVEKKYHGLIKYSVETPTEGDYSFTGEGSSSANSDLTFYSNDKKILNIELKAHNVKQKDIDKDIQKLIEEDYCGSWINIFDPEDSGTIAALIRKFKISFGKYKVPSHPISFHIIILKTKTLLARKGLLSDLENFDTNKIFNINYDDWKDLAKGQHKVNNWQIVKF